MTNTEKTQLRNLRRLSRYFDYNRSAMAESLGVESHVVYQWFSRGRISKTGAVLAEKATSGIVTAAQLRPDIAEFEG
jgi:DNA-binding transcriptional regulator YdaS (Cro superfamily)